MTQLYDHQATDVDKIYQAFTHYKRVLYTLPTGGGKSVVIEEIVRRAIAKKFILHLVVHRDKLLEQLYKRVAPLLEGQSVGWVKSGHKLIPDAQVQLVSIQSWRSRKDRLPAPNLIITDEAHRGKAATYLEHQAHYPGAYSLGVTATPCTMSGAGLNLAYDHLVSGPQMLWLTQNNFLAPLEYLRFDPIITELGRPGAGGEFQLARIGKKVKPSHYAPAAIAAYEKHIPGMPCLVFCIDIDHAHGLVDAYNETGIPSGAVTSADSDAQNEEVLAAFVRGDLLCLMSVDMFSEGVDLPFVSAMQMLRPTDSLRIYLQQIGRVTRYVKNKIGYVLDHVDNFSRHGHPLAARRWTLEGELGELERKALAKRPAKPKVQKEWEELGFSSKRAQALLDLDESDYWINWFQRVTREIEAKNYQPTALMHKLGKHHLDPPWAIYEAAGSWLARKGAAKQGWAWHKFRERYGHFPNEKPASKQPDWGNMLEDIKQPLSSGVDF
jgi:superfamily II DNA or RNA helicase